VLDQYRYRVSADTYLSIGADTSSPVVRLPVSQSTLLQRTPIVSSLYYIFVHIPAYIYNLHTPILRTKSHFQ